MNNIRWLMDDAKITNRPVADYTTISNGVLTELYNGKRQLRQTHLDRLTYFFTVTNDFILGKSNDGIGIYTDDDSELRYIDKETYMRVRDRIQVRVVESLIPITFEIIRTANYENKRVTIDHYIERVFNGKFSELVSSKELLQKYVDKMNDEQVEKTVKFIENFIL